MLQQNFSTITVSVATMIHIPVFSHSFLWYLTGTCLFFSNSKAESCTADAVKDTRKPNLASYKTYHSQFFAMGFPESLRPFSFARVLLLLERFVALGATEPKRLRIGKLVYELTTNLITYLTVVSDKHDTVSRIYWRRAEVAALYSHHCQWLSSSKCTWPTDLF